jgi:hypothetical protein
MTEEELNQNEEPVADLAETPNVLEEDDQIDAEEADEEADEEFFPADDFQLPDGASVITVSSSNGARVYVPAAEAMPLSEVLSASGLNVMMGAEFWLNGAAIKADTIVAPGSTVTIVGVVKGG